MGTYSFKLFKGSDGLLFVYIVKQIFVQIIKMPFFWKIDFEYSENMLTYQDGKSL